MTTVNSWMSLAADLLGPIWMLALACLAIASIFTFGGARRNAQALLATGVYCALTGAFYLYGVAASYYALQDNAYLINIYLGLALLLFGVCVFLPGGLAGAGLPRLAANAMGALGMAGIVGVYSSFGLSLTNGGSYVAVYLMAALVLLALLLFIVRRASLLLPALGLGLVGALLALALWLLPDLLAGSLNLAVYTHIGVDQELADKPPVLVGLAVALGPLCGTLVFFVARWLGGGQSPETSTDTPTPVAA